MIVQPKIPQMLQDLSAQKFWISMKKGFILKNDGDCFKKDNINFSKKLPRKVFQPVVYLIGIQHEFRIVNDT